MDSSGLAAFAVWFESTRTGSTISTACRRVVLTELLLSNQPVRPGSPALPGSLAGLDKLVVDHEQSLIAF